VLDQARGIPVAATYGLTEAASQVATAAPDEVAAGCGSVGRPLHHLEVRIVREDGAIAAPGETGEIRVRGPSITPGYLRDDGSLRPATADGWLRTRDLGSLDATRVLTVAGRADDVIVTAGEKVSPLEVENALRCLPGVADAAVAGVPDHEWGQVVAAWVVPCSGHRPSPDELRAACRATLAPHKLPRRVYLVDDLPRTASGKVLRGALSAGRALSGGRSAVGS
jgi:O-succinylbenzoic acid--CoA ligase